MKFKKLAMLFMCVAVFLSMAVGVSALGAFEYDSTSEDGVFTQYMQMNMANALTSADEVDDAYWEQSVANLNAVYAAAGMDIQFSKDDLVDADGNATEVGEQVFMAIIMNATIESDEGSFGEEVPEGSITQAEFDEGLAELEKLRPYLTELAGAKLEEVAEKQRAYISDPSTAVLTAEDVGEDVDADMSSDGSTDGSTDAQTDAEAASDSITDVQIDVEAVSDSSNPTTGVGVAGLATAGLVASGCVGFVAHLFRKRN